jgi:NAD(P)-dependent dehydrogenase (short-subunit alcohol dehydrogenase family)
MAKTWFITGTSTGFGRELTEQLLARGDRVAATLRRPRSLDALAARYGEQLWIRRLDVTDTPAIRTVVDGADADETPRRLLLGSDAYKLVHTALADRLAFVEAQHDLTVSTDADDYTPATG